jgi:hypothetical protein
VKFPNFVPADQNSYYVYSCPSAIVGHGFAFEHFVIQPGGIDRISNGWVVDEYDQRLAFNIDSLIVIPSIFGGHNSITDKNYFRVLYSDFLLPES